MKLARFVAQAAKDYETWFEPLARLASLCFNKDEAAYRVNELKNTHVIMYACARFGTALEIEKDVLEAVYYNPFKTYNKIMEEALLIRESKLSYNYKVIPKPTYRNPEWDIKYHTLEQVHERIDQEYQLEELPAHMRNHAKHLMREERWWFKENFLLNARKPIDLIGTPEEDLVTELLRNYEMYGE